MDAGWIWFTILLWISGEGMGGSRELGGYARERSPLPLFRASTVGSPSRSARFITSSSSTSRGRQAEKARKHTMSQQSTSCWIRRCNRQYIFLPQFTLVSRCRAWDEKFLSQTRSQASSAIAANSVSSLPQQRLDPSRRGQMIAPILSRKGDNWERSFFPQKKGSQWTHSIPSRTERTCSSPKHITHRLCVSSSVRQRWHGSTHLLKRFSTDIYTDDTVSVDFLSTCISKIKEWMSQNFLCLNSEKTEVMLIGSPHQLRKAGSITLSVDGSTSIMKFKIKLKNLGVIFDSNLTFELHVQGTVKTYFFHLRNIARLRPMLSFSVAERLINTFVFTRIDYCNALLAGASKATLNKLQVVQKRSYYAGLGVFTLASC